VAKVTWLREMTYASHPASYGSFNASHRATIGVVALVPVANLI